MARRWRVRRVVVWTGVALCAALLAVSAFTLRWSIYWLRSDYRADFCIDEGTAFCVWCMDGTPPRSTDPRTLAEPNDGIPVGWSLQSNDHAFEWGMLRPRARIWDPRYPGHVVPWSRAVQLPLWIPFLAIGVPCGLLWWRERRRVRPGHCRCGYDLTGNVSGRCSECGAAVVAGGRCA